MSELTTEIINVKQLLQIENIVIPNYQRPYKWTAKNVNQLIDDIVFDNDKSAYRLGTLVVHKDIMEERSILNIVDGQQRTLTLTLIAHALTQHCDDKLNEIYKRSETLENYKPKLINLSFSNDITKANILANYKVIERRINDFDEKSIRFFYEKCELVKVVLSDISEAFQFFDSQNARGRDLEPHDLLKAFHLREMNGFSTEEERKKTVENWEKMDTDKLSKLFSIYLFRIRNWSKGYSARYFTKNDVGVFKGVSPDVQEDFPFAKAYRIAHYYTEDYNKSYHRSIDKRKFDYPFQLDQTIINGKRFFEMIDFYEKMIETIKDNDSDVFKTIKNYTGSFRTGDKYVRDLFYCGLIYYVDKFGEKELEKAIDKIFIWAYTLRLKMFSVRFESIDNYALHNSEYSKMQLFKKIRESVSPNDLINIQLETLNEYKSTKTEEIRTLFINKKYYEKSTRTT